MCRILFIKARNGVDPHSILSDFSTTCKNSSEYQGHGWGISYFQNGAWFTEKSLQPIWENWQRITMKSSVNYFLVHARSAFQDRDIVLDNNMPFIYDRFIYAFNGEIQGVRLRTDGETGAAKIFTIFNQLFNGNGIETLGKLNRLIQKRSRYIKAMNILVIDTVLNKVYVSSFFNENKSYFQMSVLEKKDMMIISSDPLQSMKEFKPLNNASIQEWNL